MKKQEIILSGAMLCLSLGGIALTSTGCAGDRYQRSTGAYLDDKGITTRVKTALFKDPNVSSFDVHVNTFRGDVQLSGFVDTPEQKEHAASLAREVTGVRSVANNLEVKPGPTTAVGAPGATVQGSSPTVTDQTINQPVPAPAPPAPTPVLLDTTGASRLAPDTTTPAPTYSNTGPTPAYNTTTSASTYVPPANEPLLNRPDINITASNGHAILRGTATSEDEKRAIARKLLSMPGIVTVDNQLEVRPVAPLAR